MHTVQKHDSSREPRITLDNAQNPTCEADKIDPENM